MRALLVFAIAVSILTASVRQNAIDTSSRIDALMARWSGAETPGAAVVVMQGGRIVHSKGYGLANLVTKKRILPSAIMDVAPATVFDIASLSKPVTAMAIMMLVERRKLSDADTLAKFFPEFQAEARAITVRQLLTHTSGLRDYTLDWGETRKLGGGTPRTNENVVKYLAGQKVLRFHPGDRWEYSNSNYVLLAQIVSIVTGEPFAQFVRDDIFRPLLMNDSFVYDKARGQGAAAIVNRAIGYVARGSGFRPAEGNAENYVVGDGQVNTTAEDLAKWDRAIDSGTLVMPSTLAAAFAPGRLNDGTPLTYGFGWGLGRYRGLRVTSHGGETDGFAAQLTRFPDQHLTVIILSNDEQLSPPPFALANRIADLYLSGDVKSPVSVGLTPERLRDYAGRYSLYDATLGIAAEAGALWLQPPGQPKVKLTPVSADEFALDRSEGASSIGFNRNARGQVTCLSLLDQNGTMWCRR